MIQNRLGQILHVRFMTVYLFSCEKCLAFCLLDRKAFSIVLPPLGELNVTERFYEIMSINCVQNLFIKKVYNSFFLVLKLCYAFVYVLESLVLK